MILYNEDGSAKLRLEARHSKVARSFGNDR